MCKALVGLRSHWYTWNDQRNEVKVNKSMHLAARGHTVGVSRVKLVNLRWQSVRAKVGEKEKKAEMP
jgi:hypothetical protein